MGRKVTAADLQGLTAQQRHNKIMEIRGSASAPKTSDKKIGFVAIAMALFVIIIIIYLFVKKDFQFFENQEHKREYLLDSR
jgi:hypothetical protein